MATYGVPGPVYLDFAADVIYGKIEESEIHYLEPIPRLPPMIARQQEIDQTLELLRNAKSPLIIVGKGVAYADAQEEFRAFARAANVPVLASPMGKGIMKDSDALVVNSART